MADVSAPMLVRARSKGLATLRADAAALPLADASFDAVTLVSMIHHVPDFRAALREARRVVAPGGRVAVMGWAREHVEQVTWLAEYFPSTREWMDTIHESLAELRAELPGARVLPVFFDDALDMSVGALQRFPELLLRPELRAQTSFFERLEQRAPDELEAGLARLAADLECGLDPRERVAAARARLGDASVLAWTRPR